MRSRFVSLLAIIMVTSCRAFVLHEEEMEPPLEIEELAETEGRLGRLLETVRQILKNGNATLGIPVLDPLQVQHLDLNLKEKGLVELQGALNNIHAVGLSTYAIDRADLAIIGLMVNVSLTWNEIDLMTDYTVASGKIADSLSIFGDGTIAAVIKGLTVSVDMKLGVKDEALYAKTLTLHAHLKGLDFKITGLYNDEEMSNLASRLVSDLTPKLIEDYQNELSLYGSPIVANQLNKVLQKIPLSSILG